MTPTEAEAMTTDQHRDWCAVDDGWQKESVEDLADPSWWRWNAHPTLKSRTWCKGHPHPPTRDGAADALPAGWTWRRYGSEGWRAFTTDGPLLQAKTPDTGDEIADRFRLAVACRLAMREATNGNA